MDRQPGNVWQPGRIGSLQLPHRLIMGSMHLNLEGRDDDGAALAEFYAERVRGGAGLITTGGAAVSRVGAGGRQYALINETTHQHRLGNAAQTVHAEGGLIAAQLFHAGRYAFEASFGLTPVAPSAVYSRFSRATPEAMTDDQIRETLQDFADGAAAARSAGFDAVEVMASEGYLINQFLSPVTNLRDDHWGGDPLRRRNFPLALADAIRRAIGDMPLIFRISGADLVDGSSSIDEITDYAVALARSGVDALNVGVGWHEAAVPTVQTLVPQGVWVPYAERIKDAVRAAGADVPVIASNRVNKVDHADQLLDDGSIDFVSMARPFLADPHIIAKARRSRPELINTCIACNEACIDRSLGDTAVSCLVNPRAGRELEFVERANTGGPSTSSGPVEGSSGPVETRPESGNHRPESGNHRAESGNHRAESGNHRPESGNHRAESGNHRAESGNHRPEPEENRPELVEGQTPHSAFPTDNPGLATRCSGRYAVIGGGLAGLEAARSLAHLGQQVTLYDAEDGLGGQFRLARTVPSKADFGETIRYFDHELARLGVRTRLGRPVSTDEVAAMTDLDGIVLATGVTPRRPDIPGSDHAHVLDYHQAFENPDKIGDRVAIVGGGGIAVDLAHLLVESHDQDDRGNSADDLKLRQRRFLAEWGVTDDPAYHPEAATEVTVMRRKGKIGAGMGVTTRWTVVGSIRHHGARLLTDLSYDAITPDGVRIRHADGSEELIAADTVIIAAGQEPNAVLADAVAASGVPYRIIGGAADTAGLNAVRATSQGLEAAHELAAATDRS